MSYFYYEPDETYIFYLKNASCTHNETTYPYKLKSTGHNRKHDMLILFLW